MQTMYFVNCFYSQNASDTDDWFICDMFIFVHIDRPIKMIIENDTEYWK